MDDSLDYVNHYGILLEDVLESRKKAQKKHIVSICIDHKCPRCGNTKLESFQASNGPECWRSLCGVEGMCLFCDKCMDLVEFTKYSES